MPSDPILLPLLSEAALEITQALMLCCALGAAGMSAGFLEACSEQSLACRLGAFKVVMS